MAKTSKPTTPATPSEPTDEQLAAQAIRCITGCGTIEADKRVAGLSPSTIQKLAAGERENKRSASAALLREARAADTTP